MSSLPEITTSDLERVAVGPLVGGEDEAIAVAQLGDDAIDLRRHGSRRLAHSASSPAAASSSSSCEILIPDSTVGS